MPFWPEKSSRRTFIHIPLGVSSTGFRQLLPQIDPFCLRFVCIFQLIDLLWYSVINIPIRYDRNVSISIYCSMNAKSTSFCHCRKARQYFFQIFLELASELGVPYIPMGACHVSISTCGRRRKLRWESMLKICLIFWRTNVMELRPRSTSTSELNSCAQQRHRFIICLRKNHSHFFPDCFCIPSGVRSRAQLFQVPLLKANWSVRMPFGMFTRERVIILV